MNTQTEFPDEPSSEASFSESQAPLTTDSPATISPLTLLRFLVGNQQAILDIARSRHTIWLGGILVLSAGFAREYDGEYLLREPWHLFIPHAASFVTSFVLYCMVILVALRRKAALPNFIRGFEIFLGLYWLTAPLAWAYAIPFERWTSPGAATQLNLMLLGGVAFWRVVLIIRVIRVAFGARSLVNVTMTVLLFGDWVMLTAIEFMPIPILHMMGGIRLTETEAVIHTTSVLLRLAGVLAFPILLIGYALAFRAKPEWESPNIRTGGKVSSSTWLVAALSVLAWGVVLPLTQSEQELRWQVDRDLENDRIAELLRLMSTYDRSDFPPNWVPAPHVAFAQHSPHIADVVAVVLAEKPADWVREIYLNKFQRKFAEVFYIYSEAPVQEKTQYLKVLADLPLKSWCPDEDWEVQELRGVLQVLANDEEAEVSSESRKLVLDALSRLPERTLPDSRQPEDDSKSESTDKSVSAGPAND